MNLPVAHTTSHRVGYAETDQMGVAHHSVHVIWFERARIELLRALGANYRELEGRGVVLPVREMRVRYHRPARFDDELAIEATLAEVTRVRCHFDYRVTRPADDALIAEGAVELAFCDTAGRINRQGLATLREMVGQKR